MNNNFLKFSLISSDDLLEAELLEITPPSVKRGADKLIRRGVHKVADAAQARVDRSYQKSFDSAMEKARSEVPAEVPVDQSRIDSLRAEKRNIESSKSPDKGRLKELDRQINQAEAINQKVKAVHARRKEIVDNEITQTGGPGEKRAKLKKSIKRGRVAGVKYAPRAVYTAVATAGILTALYGGTAAYKHMRRVFRYRELVSDCKKLPSDQRKACRFAALKKGIATLESEKAKCRRLDTPDQIRRCTREFNDKIKEYRSWLEKG